ncbi:MAG TPA: hypothetical protein VF791_09305 [Pyrinomonadaceae bacterium]
MKTAHLIVGVIVVVAFLLTGQFMDFHQPKMEELDGGTRMMFRSRHIYILLAGLVNLGIGAYFTYHKEGWRRTLQLIGSCLVIIAPFLLLGAFFYEPKLGGLDRPFTLPAILALSIGALCHLFSGMRRGE